MNIATMRVQRICAWDGTGIGTTAGPVRWTANRMDQIAQELTEFELEMDESIGANWERIYPAWLETDGGRMIYVAQFRQRGGEWAR